MRRRMKLMDRRNVAVARAREVRMQASALQRMRWVLDAEADAADVDDADADGNEREESLWRCWLW
jgi:hypothetical protein